MNLTSDYIFSSFLYFSNILPLSTSLPSHSLPYFHFHAIDIEILSVFERLCKVWSGLKVESDRGVEDLS